MDSPSRVPTSEGFRRTPVAVVIDDQEWTARSLDSILGAAGYAVLKAYNGRQAAELIGRVRPDIVFVDLHLPDVEGMTLYRGFLESGMVDAATPVIALSPGRIDRSERLEAIAQGAWDVLGLPLDADELVLRLGNLVRAKQSADAAREESLVDAETGLYNARGVLQKLSELRSDASRSGRGLACIVVGPRDEGALPASWLPDPVSFPGDGTPGTLGHPRRKDDPALFRIRASTRRSDAKGALGRTVFVVVAPNTDAPGARRLAERILAGVESPEPGATSDLVAGLFAESDLGASGASASEFLSRATEAFRKAQVGSQRIRVLEAEPAAN